MAKTRQEELLERANSLFKQPTIDRGAELRSRAETLFPQPKALPPSETPPVIPEEERFGDQVVRTVEEPGRLFNEGVSQLGDNPVAGALNMVNGLLQTGLLPFTASFAFLDEALRGTGLDPVADVIMAPFEATSQAVAGGQELIDVGLDKAGVSEKIRNLGLEPETAEGIVGALTPLNQTFAQLLTAKGLGSVGVKGRKLVGAEKAPIIEGGALDPTKTAQKLIEQRKGKSIPEEVTKKEIEAVPKSKPTRVRAISKPVEPLKVAKKQKLPTLQEVKKSAKKGEKVGAFREFLENREGVELVQKKKLGVTGKGEKIGAFTQKTETGHKVTFADFTPETSFAKEIGRVLFDKAKPKLKEFQSEYQELGLRGGAKDKFATAVKEVTTNPELRTKAPELVKFLESEGVPFEKTETVVKGEVPDVASTQAQRAKISEQGQGKPGQSHFKSLKNFTTEKELNSYIDQVGKNSEKSRGKLSKDIVDDLATDLGLTEKDILKLKKGEARNVETVRGMKQIIADNTGQLADFVNETKGKKLSTDQAQQLKDMYLTHQTMRSKVMGLVTESARVLQETQRPVSAREFDVLSDIHKTLAESGIDVNKPEQVSQALKNLTRREKFVNYAVEVLNVPRSIMTAFDLSAPLRQGLILSARHPVLALKSAFPNMFKAFGSEKVMKALEKNILEDPQAPLMKKADLFLADRNLGRFFKDLKGKEETQIGAELTEKIPLLGRGIKASNRAFNAYLNTLRVDVFKKQVEALQKQGETFENNPKAYKDVANFINLATGRGSLGKIGNRAAPILSAAMFSPRNLAAKFQLLNPRTYTKMEPQARKFAIQSMLSMVGANITLLSLAKMAGAEIELDPRSSDFGKGKIGNTRVDPWGGFQQVVRFLAQFTTGQIKKAGSGEIVNVSDVDKFTELIRKEYLPKGKEKFPFTSRAGLVGGAVRGKLSPQGSMLFDALIGKNMAYEDFNVTDALADRAFPLFIQDVIEVFKEDPALATAIAPLGLFGFGLQSFEAKPKKKKIFK